MKYTIEGFSQEFAMSLTKQVENNGKTITRKIDCTDLVILRWFVDFYPNMKKIEVDGKQYAWLTHKKLQEDLPLIDISKRSFIDRMQKLVEFDVLEYRLLKEGGTFSLYGFGKNYHNLISKSENADGMQSNCTGAVTQSAEGMQSNNIGVCSQTDNKDNSIKDTSIKNNSINKSRKRNSFDEIITAYSSNEKTVDLLQEWLKVRKAKRAAMTDRAIQMNIDKLDSLAEASGLSVNDYLSEVICRGWAAFYKINNYSSRQDGKTYGINGIAITDEKSDLDDLF
jgi:hypothetical protein